MSVRSNAGSPEPSLFNNVIVRDYHMEFWLSLKVSARNPIISLRALWSRVDTEGYNQKPML